MPIDVEKLLCFPIPVGRQILTPRDAALYALSIGMGRDPLDGDQLRYVDPVQGPVVMPAMVLVMAHPGFWLAHPESGVDPTAVLHASQSFEILAPLPINGMIESRTRITSTLDKGPGKAALIVSETELKDSSERVFARLDRTTFVRNGGGFGGASGPSAPPEEPLPPDAPDAVVDLPTGREQALLYRLNGDLNPLHSDPDVARKAGFPAPILHGLATMGVVAHAVLRTLAGYQADRIRSLSLRFASPVFPGETIRTELWKGGQFRVRVVDRNLTVAGSGRATIAPAKNPSASENVA